MLSLSSLPLPILALFSIATASLVQNSMQNSTCPQHLYNVQIISNDPLVIYIPSFITTAEATHLQAISKDHFSSSQIADSSGQQQLAKTRTSRSTSLASDDVVRCIEERALQFQGYDIPRERLEPLQLVSYGESQNYAPHTDWFTSPSQTTKEFGGNRETSFFVYVAVSEDIVGGGTGFPLVDAPRDERWCGVVNCDAAWDEGTVFRPKAGNAVFWRNMKGGRGDGRTLHAGLPVQRGKKLGMNIWTREGMLDEKYRSKSVE